MWDEKFKIDYPFLFNEHEMILFENINNYVDLLFLNKNKDEYIKLVKSIRKHYKEIINTDGMNIEFVWDMMIKYNSSSYFNSDIFEYRTWKIKKLLNLI